MTVLKDIIIFIANLLQHFFHSGILQSIVGTTYHVTLFPIPFHAVQYVHGSNIDSYS